MRSKRHPSLTSLPTVIATTGNYLTARGERVEIYRIDDVPYGAYGEFIPSGATQIWDISGRLFHDKASEGEL